MARVRAKKKSFSRFFPWRFSSPNFLKIAALLWSFGPNLQETPDSQPLPLAPSLILWISRTFPPKPPNPDLVRGLTKMICQSIPQNLVRQHTPANKAFPAGPLVNHWLGTRSSWRKKAREHGKPPLSRTFSQHLKTMNMCVLLYRAQKKTNYIKIETCKNPWHQSSPVPVHLPSRSRRTISFFHSCWPFQGRRCCGLKDILPGTHSVQVYRART